MSFQARSCLWNTKEDILKTEKCFLSMQLNSMGFKIDKRYIFILSLFERSLFWLH